MTTFSVPIGRKRVHVTLEPRKHGGVLHCRFYWRGRPRWKSTKTHDLAKARAFAYSYVEAVAGGKIEDATDLEGFVSAYLSEKWPPPHENNRSYTFARNQLSFFLAFAGAPLQIASLPFDTMRDLIQDFLGHRKKSIGAVALDNQRRALSGFFSWLILGRHVPYQANPASKKLHVMPKIERRVQPPATSEQITRLLNAARSHKIYSSLVLLLATGMRRAGLNGLKWGHINLEQRYLRLHEKKRDRIIPLSQWAVDELKPFKRSAKRLVLETHIDDFSHDLAKIKWRAKVNLDVKALRRAFLKKLFDAGVAPQLAASIAGNSLGVITRHYVDLGTMNATSVVDALDYAEIAKNHSKNRSKLRRFK